MDLLKDSHVNNTQELDHITVPATENSRGEIWWEGGGQIEQRD